MSEINHKALTTKREYKNSLLIIVNVGNKITSNPNSTKMNGR